MAELNNYRSIQRKGKNFNISSVKWFHMNIALEFTWGLISHKMVNVCPQFSLHLKQPQWQNEHKENYGKLESVILRTW